MCTVDLRLDKLNIFCQVTIKHVLQTLIIGEYHEPCSIGAHLIDHRIVTQKCFFLRFNEMIAMSRVFRIERRNMGSEFDHSVNPNILVKY